MKKISGAITALLLISVLHVQAQTDKTGKQALDKLCGCFEVEFKYAETFSPDSAYKFHDREKTENVIELALPIEVTDKKIVIQHLLVIKSKIVVKHWREEWTYENPVYWKYEGDRVWVKRVLPAEQVKGKWTQTVWEVSDEPRYQGYGQFVTLDEKILWQSTTDAPLPRREYTVRNDYNILKRTNRINITDEGYVHEQDNEKIIRENGKDKLLAEEKGLNTYKRTEESKCAAGLTYWEKNKEYWTVVRQVWDEYISKLERIELKAKVEGKQLNEYLSILAKQFADNKVAKAALYLKVKEEISKFVEKERFTMATSN